MKNKKLLTMGLIALIGTTTLTGCAGGNYNPANWNWEWLNPVNWFKNAEPVTSDEVEPSGKVKKIEFDIKPAFGQAGAKTVTLIVTPANANLGTITWSDDSNFVTVTPNEINPLQADVYVTGYFKDYATISVHESFSDITATGKVYSYGKFDFPETGGSDYTHILDATASAVAITSTSSTLQATVQDKATLNRTKLNTLNGLFSYYDTSDLLGSKRSQAHSGWTVAKATVWLHIAFTGSYTPVVLNHTTGTVYNATNYTLHDKQTYLNNDIGNIISIEITLAQGDNLILLAGRKHTATPSVITVADFNNGEFNTSGKLVGAKSHQYNDFATPFIITNATAPQGLAIPDTTFYE